MTKSTPIDDTSLNIKCVKDKIKEQIENTQTKCKAPDRTRTSRVYLRRSTFNPNYPNAR